MGLDKSPREMMLNDVMLPDDQWLWHNHSKVSYCTSQ